MIEKSLNNPEVIAIRYDLANLVASAFISVGKEISIFKEINCLEKENINRVDLEDETASISLIAGIAGDLTKSASILYRAGPI